MSSDLLKQHIKKIGKGPKLAKDLTQDEAYEALAEILNSNASDTQIGAFFIALRIKRESSQEIAGMVKALRENANILNHNYEKLLELAPAHDGKKKSLVLSPFVAMALAKNDIQTVVTGGVDVPTKKGVSPESVFRELGITTNLDADGVTDQLNQRGFAYYDVSKFCPALEKLKPFREEFGLRIPLNTVEKLINPTNATHLATGVFHGPFLQSIGEACVDLGYRNVFCVQATEASTDLPLKKRVLYRQVSNGGLSEQSEINPEEYGLKRKIDLEFEAVTAKSNVDQVQKALSLKKGDVYDSLVYNIGVYLHFMGKVDDIEVGMNRAKDTLLSF